MPRRRLSARGGRAKGPSEGAGRRLGLLPLAGLTKRRVRAVARHLGGAEALVMKVPTADLEALRPLLPDETAYGVTYDQIDDFLEGKPVDDHVYETVLRFYEMTRHKRALPYTPFDWPHQPGGVV